MTTKLTFATADIDSTWSSIFVPLGSRLSYAEVSGTLTQMYWEQTAPDPSPTSDGWMTVDKYLVRTGNSVDGGWDEELPDARFIEAGQFWIVPVGRTLIRALDPSGLQEVQLNSVYNP